MKYTYNGIIFDNININTYSNIGAKLKHHSLTTIKDNEDLLPYSVTDALFINWNGANIPNSLVSINKINNTPDLIKYLIELNVKIKYLENELIILNNNKIYPITFELKNLKQSGDTYVSKNATLENPNISIITPNIHYNLPNTINVIGCEYNYTNGTIKLYNVNENIEKITINAIGEIKEYNIIYDNLLANNKIQLSSNKPTLITYETKKESPKTFTISSQKYYIENLLTSINNCQYSFDINESKKIITIKLWEAINNIILPDVITYYKVNLSNIVLNNCSGIYNEEYKLYNDNDVIEIKLLPNENYFINNDSINISGCNYILDNNTLTLSNFNTETPSIIINANKQSNEYIFIGYDKNTSNYPNNLTIQNIINNNYYSNDDENLINNEGIITNTSINYNQISNNYYYNNILINNIKSITNDITLNVNIVLGKYKNNILYILIPQSYNILSIKDNLNYELKNNLFINTGETTSIDSIIYNIYKTIKPIDFGLNLLLQIEKLN